MKKHFCLIFTVLFLLVVSFGAASAGDEYSNDFFILKNGKIKTADAVLNDIFKKGVDVEVTRTGVASRLVESFNVEGCSGNASFGLEGERDTKSGEMKGDIEIAIGGACTATKEIPASQFSRIWRGTFDGYATFAVERTDGSKRTTKGQINSLLRATRLIIDGVNVELPSTANVKFSIDFPEAVLEGYTDVRPDSGARFSGMTGQVEWRPDDDPDGWRLCKLDTVLPVYAHVRTAEYDSSAILSFADMSTFVLKADSEVVIDTSPEKESKIKLIAGNIWVNVKKMVLEGSMSMEMNQAVAGIKGTTFAASDDGKISTLQVIEGEVLFTSKSSGEKINVAGGSMVSASSAGLGSVETFDTVKVAADWNAVSDGIKGVGVDSTKEAGVNSNKETGSFKSKGTLLLYGLIGIIAIFIIIIIIRKIKKIKN